MKHEGRVARLFQALSDRGCRCEAFAVVKEKSRFEYDCVEYVAWADTIAFHPLKILVKLLETQWAGWKAYRRHFRDADTLILANHEFFPLGIMLAALSRKAIFIDLHEHYYSGLLGQKWFGGWFFLQLFSGVIFANRARAEELLGELAGTANVIITRNMPVLPPGNVATPAFVVDDRLVLAIVGAPLPGRYIRETLKVLDTPEMASVIKIRTFGRRHMLDLRDLEVEQHGPFHHSKIDDLTRGIDGSFVFYDPGLNDNNRLCEPNRFFQAYNLGKLIFCFDHPSLSEFYDEGCHIVDRDDFAQSLRSHVLAAVACKRNPAAPTFDRRLLRYEDGLVNIGALIEPSRSHGKS